MAGRAGWLGSAGWKGKGVQFRLVKTANPGPTGNLAARRPGDCMDWLGCMSGRGVIVVKTASPGPTRNLAAFRQAGWLGSRPGILENGWLTGLRVVTRDLLVEELFLVF